MIRFLFTLLYSLSSRQEIDKRDDATACLTTSQMVGPLVGKTAKSLAAVIGVRTKRRSVASLPLRMILFFIGTRSVSTIGTRSVSTFVTTLARIPVAGPYFLVWNVKLCLVAYLVSRKGSLSFLPPFCRSLQPPVSCQYHLVDAS